MVECWVSENSRSASRFQRNWQLRVYLGVPLHVNKIHDTFVCVMCVIYKTEKPPLVFLEF